MRKKGLELSEAYYRDYGQKMIREGFSEYEQYMAVGLVGEGSECFGFDDEISEDHDFGPGFCIWLPDDIYLKIGAALQHAYGQLPKVFEGKCRMETPEGRGRTGVFSIAEFYKKYTGCSDVPKSSVEWLLIPETSLCTATNGMVFEDHLGAFTRIRSGLLNFYPKDIFRKKLVARLAVMSQSGQYNYERCMKRGEQAAAYLACSEFIKASVSAAYLLNQKSMPFYKWMFRGMEGLTVLGELAGMLKGLAGLPDCPEHTASKVAMIEAICIKVREELNRQEIVSGTDNFLQNYCGRIMESIADPQIRSLPVMYDCR